MPTQKRPRDSSASPSSPHPPLEEEKPDDMLPGSENHVSEKLDDLSDSEGSSSSGNGENEEFIVVKLAEVRKEVQCPICLGIIRKTRTVMECLHRFCRECIDKSMRLGNNECPACRTHCASRRSLRDDPNYDALISALYPDIDKYEEEELIFHEEDKTRNEKIQALIALTFRRQADALGKKRTPIRSTAATSRRHSSSRKSRGRRNHRSVGHNESDEEEAMGNDRSKDSSSTDEHSAEARTERPKRWSSSRTSKPSSGVNIDGDENDSELHAEASGTVVGRLKVLEWGRSGTRTNTRRAGHTWTNGRISRQNRLSKLMSRLQSSNENDDVSKITLKLVSLDEEEIPSLKRPYICCSTTSSVRHLTQYVAMQTSIEASQIQMCIVNDAHSDNISKLFVEKFPVIYLNTHEMVLLKERETVDEILVKFTPRSLVLAYHQKKNPDIAWLGKSNA